MHFIRRYFIAWKTKDKAQRAIKQRHDYSTGEKLYWSEELQQNVIRLNIIHKV